MCTTNPEKIPKTILSRVQRYQFQRISQKGIVDRLQWITEQEYKSIYGDAPRQWSNFTIYGDALEYIAKIADGGMRDAITLLDKCLAFSTEVTLENVVKAVGATDYDTMIRLTKAILADDEATMFEIIDGVHNAGKDLKLFIRSYLEFILDVCKYDVTKSFELIKIPQYYKADIEKFLEIGSKLLKCLLRLNNDIKYDANPKFLIEAELYQFNMEG
jgi:DNA polymerase-3 subunit gamma/tau